MKCRANRSASEFIPGYVSLPRLMSLLTPSSQHVVAPIEMMSPGAVNAWAHQLPEVMTMRAKKRPGVDDATTRRLNVRVTSEAYERLLVHAIKARVSPGDLVTELIATHCRQYRVQVNSAVRGQSEVSVDPAGEARESEPIAA